MNYQAIESSSLANALWYLEVSMTPCSPMTQQDLTHSWYWSLLIGAIKCLVGALYPLVYGDSFKVTFLHLCVEACIVVNFHMAFPMAFGVSCPSHSHFFIPSFNSHPSPHLILLVWFLLDFLITPYSIFPSLEEPILYIPWSLTRYLTLEVVEIEIQISKCKS